MTARGRNGDRPAARRSLLGRRNRPRLNPSRPRRRYLLQLAERIDGALGSQLLCGTRTLGGEATACLGFLLRLLLARLLLLGGTLGLPGFRLGRRRQIGRASC